MALEKRTLIFGALSCFISGEQESLSRTQWGQRCTVFRSLVSLAQVRPPLARAPRGLHQRHHSRAHHGHRSHPSCSLGLRSFRHHPLHSTALGRQPYLRRCTGRMGSLGPLPRGPRSRPRLSQARPWPATLRSQVRRAGAGGLPPGEWAVSQGSGRPSLTLQGGCLLNSVATVDERGTIDSHTALCASLRGSETAAC